MKKGFTLIELILVIVILGILVALMIPQMSAMRERARTAEAKGVIGALRTSLVASYMESDAWPATMTTNGAINTALGTIIDIGTTLFNYDITTDGNAAIVATRNNRSWTAGNGATVSMSIGPAGVVTTGLTVEYNIPAPDAPDS